MMRSDKINWYDHGGYKETTAPYSNFYVRNESESKCSIVHQTLLQKYSAKENELRSTKNNESEFVNKKKKRRKE